MNPLQRVIDTVKPICDHVSSNHDEVHKAWSIAARKKLPGDKYARMASMHGAREEYIDESMVDFMIKTVVFDIANMEGKATYQSYKKLLDKCLLEYEQSTKIE